MQDQAATQPYEMLQLLLRCHMQGLQNTPTCSHLLHQPQSCTTPCAVYATQGVARSSPCLQPT
jgi:hypothetical protein